MHAFAASSAALTGEHINNIEIYNNNNNNKIMPLPVRDAQLQLKVWRISNFSCLNSTLGTERASIEGTVPGVEFLEAVAEPKSWQPKTMIYVFVGMLQVVS